MASSLHDYLADAYKSQHNFSLPKKHLRNAAVQIDDQDDKDSITDFCNIFCTVLRKNTIVLELSGRFPVTRELADLADIYKGYIDPRAGKLAVTLTLDQIEVLRDISDALRKTALLAEHINNPSWLSISARTISSLYRFIRIIKEFRQSL